MSRSLGIMSGAFALKNRAFALENSFFLTMKSQQFFDQYPGAMDSGCAAAISLPAVR
jgi:hypothetical protein